MLLLRLDVLALVLRFRGFKSPNRFSATGVIATEICALLVLIPNWFTVCAVVLECGCAEADPELPPPPPLPSSMCDVPSNSLFDPTSVVGEGICNLRFGCCFLKSRLILLGSSSLPFLSIGEFIDCNSMSLLVCSCFITGGVLLYIELWCCTASNIFFSGDTPLEPRVGDGDLTLMLE